MMALFSPHPGHHGRPRRAGRDDTAVPEKAAAPVPSPGEAPAPLPAPLPEVPAPAPEAPSLSWRTSPEEAGAAVVAAGAELSGGQGQAACDLDARWPAVVTDGDDEPLPRRVPGATLPPVPEFGSPADLINGYLSAPERPEAGQMRQLVDAVRAWDPQAPAGTAPRPAVPPPPPAAPRHAASEPERDPAPGAAVLLALGGDRHAVAALDGMPERRTVSGRPVIHLGDDPRHEGEAFAIADVSDAWLDALITAALDERGARRAARDGGTGPQATGPAPSFTPRLEG